MNTLDIIYEAIDELNEDIDQELVKSEDTVIFGANSSLDSMDLVNLITLIEERLENVCGEFVAIADERAMALESSPFRSIGTLNEYIQSIVPQS